MKWILDALYARDTHWAQHLEGSYAPRAELRSPGPEQWLFLDNGATTLEWDRHCNSWQSICPGTSTPSFAGPSTPPLPISRRLHERHWIASLRQLLGVA